MPNEKTTLKEQNKIIQNCLDNAESLVLTAEELKNKKGRKNIAYTLAAFALEEVGKASMLKSIYSINESGAELERDVNMGTDDHVKKLFWAFWGASFSIEKIIPALIDQYKGLATSIHNRRLEYLYTDTMSSQKPTITTKELSNILGLARARLMMEKSYELPTTQNKEKSLRLKWFLEASRDTEKRKMIFGSASFKKLAELNDTNSWVDWLYEEFQQAHEDAIQLIQQELKRKKPEGVEAKKDKWQVEVRLNSQSHALRNSVLDEWNKVIDSPKLFVANKNELIAKFTLPASVHVAGVWKSSLYLLNLFLIAINAGAMGGIIFRNIPRDAAKFHDKVIDLELKKEITIELNKTLNIDWKSARFVLDGPAMIRAQKVLLMLVDDTRHELKLHDSLAKYLQGIVMFSKTDIHLRLELNAFEMFMDCLIELIKEDNLNITDDNLKQEIPKVYHLDSYDEFYRYVDAWFQLKKDRKTIEEITLTDVVGAKMFCDFYILARANSHIKTLQEQGKLSNAKK